MPSDTLEAILEFAIQREEEAHRFYSGLAQTAISPNMSNVFMDFAHEEMGHKAKLLAVKSGAIKLSSDNKTWDLKISDYVVDVEPRDDIDFQEALILAMKREKASYRLYSDLAETVADSEAQKLFLFLANEEAKHKLRFEIEYDELMLEN